jgi:hypothetical protein
VSLFRWAGYDVTSLLPGRWGESVLAAAADADVRDYPRTPVLSREAAEVEGVTRGRVRDVRARLPWLYRLYREVFPDLGSAAWGEPLAPARDDRYGVVLNVQEGTGMRFECHVDSNPVTGLLFLTSHLYGGELVAGHDPQAGSVGEVEADCSVIRPQAGHLIFFDGRTHPHYARPLILEDAVRIVAVMNFYTQSCPEETRPAELNRHLFGEG